MDIPRLVRRLSSYGFDENQNSLAAVAPTAMSSSLGASRGSAAGLTVDTSVAKTLSFRKADEPQWGGHETPLGRQPTPSSTRSDDSELVLRRRRSNSECLMLAKNNGTQDLPGPCKEYISSVKQILARTDESRPAARRRSMSMRNNSAVGGGVTQ